jgi:uncharacterized membrane protein YfcA
VQGLDLAILCGAALATSILSAIIGMAGGIVLLSVMLLYFEPLAAIPLHGVIQLVSNSSRTFIQRLHVQWGLVWCYALLLLPMAALGLYLAMALPPDAATALIGVFVLVATWRPRWLMMGTHPEQTNPRRRFVLLGGVIGFLQMTVGATGPLIAPFFLNLGLERRAVVGTKAAVQTLGHVTKILLFGIVGFAYPQYVVLLAAMCGCVILGTWIGSRLLDRVNERAFVLLFKGALTLIAVRLVVWA